MNEKDCFCLECKKHFKMCMNEKTMECHKLHKGIKDFWESHREEDTDNGKYDGWIE